MFNRYSCIYPGVVMQDSLGKLEAQCAEKTKPCALGRSPPHEIRYCKKPLDHAVDQFPFFIFYFCWKSPGLFLRSAPIDFHHSASPCRQIPLAWTPICLSCAGGHCMVFRCCPSWDALSHQSSNSAPIVHSLVVTWAVPLHLILRIVITRLLVRDGQTPISPYLHMQCLNAPPGSVAHSKSAGKTKTHLL